MLLIKPIMNSCVEDILGFKTCCGAKSFDQNLEIHLTNAGPATIAVPSRFELHGDFGSREVRAVAPFGVHELKPGETKAFYCFMDQGLWQRSKAMVWRDQGGRTYQQALI